MSRVCGTCHEPISAHGRRKVDLAERAQIATYARTRVQERELVAYASRTCPLERVKGTGRSVFRPVRKKKRARTKARRS